MNEGVAIDFRRGIRKVAEEKKEAQDARKARVARCVAATFKKVAQEKGFGASVMEYLNDVKDKASKTPAFKPSTSAYVGAAGLGTILASLGAISRATSSPESHSILSNPLLLGLAGAGLGYVGGNLLDHFSNGGPGGTKAFVMPTLKGDNSDSGDSKLKTWGLRGLYGGGLLGAEHATRQLVNMRNVRKTTDAMNVLNEYRALSAKNPKNQALYHKMLTTKNEVAQRLMAEGNIVGLKELGYDPKDQSKMKALWRSKYNPIKRIVSPLQATPKELGKLIGVGDIMRRVASRPAGSSATKAVLKGLMKPHKGRIGTALAAAAGLTMLGRGLFSGDND